MEKGTSKDVTRVFRMIDADDQMNISNFCRTCFGREYKRFTNSDAALIHCDSTKGYSIESRDAFTNYSGFNYRLINACARGRGNYEKHGHCKEREKYEVMASALRETIEENQRSIGNVSYCPGQNEYLINVWNMAHVVDVSMDGNDGAIVRAQLIPKYVYDKAYRHDKGIKK